MMTPELKKKIEEHEKNIKFLQEENKKLFDVFELIQKYRFPCTKMIYVESSEYNDLCNENKRLRSLLETERMGLKILVDMELPFSKTVAYNMILMIDNVLKNKNSKE